METMGTTEGGTEDKFQAILPTDAVASRSLPQIDGDKTPEEGGRNGDIAAAPQTHLHEHRRRHGSSLHHRRRAAANPAPRQEKFPLKGTAVFWLPKNATEALKAVKASITAIQNGRFREEFLNNGESKSENAHNGELSVDAEMKLGTESSPWNGDGRDFDAVMKKINKMPLDQSQPGTEKIPANPKSLSKSSQKPRRRVISSNKGALLIMKKRFEREEWCETEPLKQKVKEAGCITKTIVNRFCYGQCNSFYVPKHSKKKKRNDVPRALKSCSICKPSRGSWTTVTLACPNLPGAKFKTRRVYTVKQCKCVNEVIR